MPGARGGPPPDVRQNVAHGSIVTVVVAGDVYAQGSPVLPMDPRGFHRTDMHGMMSIDIGGKIVVGRPVPSVRRGNG